MRTSVFAALITLLCSLTQPVKAQQHALSGQRGKIRLLPAWPREWDVEFRLHAPHKTTIECKAQSGKIRLLKVTPNGRQEDAVLNCP